MSGYKIQLTQDKFAIIDACDFEEISKYKWHTSYERGRYYAKGWVVDREVYMHRHVLKTSKDKLTDHINGNGLDNRRCNLREVTRRENNWNKRSNRNSTSKYKGVSWLQKRKKWLVQIKGKFIGYFDNEIDAAIAYDKKAREIYREYAYLNFNEGRASYVI